MAAGLAASAEGDGISISSSAVSSGMERGRCGWARAGWRQRAARAVASHQVFSLRNQSLIVPHTWPRTLDYFGTPLVIEPSAGLLSGDAGLLPIRQFDQRIGLTRAFADALDDPRAPDLTEHSFLEMVRSRVFGSQYFGGGRRPSVCCTSGAISFSKSAITMSRIVSSGQPIFRSRLI